jgi:hypothetical protein
MFYLLTKTEIGKFKLIYSFDNFTIEVGKHKLSKKLVEISNINGPNDDFELNNNQISLNRFSDKSGYKININKKKLGLMGIIGSTDFKSVGLGADKNSVYYEHKDDDRDRTAYDKYKTFLLHTTSLNKADIYVPYIFSLITLIVFLSKYLGCI